ncbi:MAG: hypothetical protein WBA16_10260 [Nonlabens sp.]
MSKKIINSICLGLFCCLSLVAQPPEEEDRKLNGGSITVVKAYDPTLSDAFKVKTMPNTTDTVAVKKRAVTYSIFSVPVASTFRPSKGKITKLKAKPRPDYFDNYARLGLGNYINVLAEFAATLEIDRESDFNVFLNHNSSQGGIDEVVTDDDFSNTSLDLSYDRRTRDLNWTAGAGARYRTANWYGGFPRAALALNEDSDVGLNYFSYGIGGEISLFNGVLKTVDLQAMGLSSGEGASEFRVRLQPQLEFDIRDTAIALGVDLDYLSGSFDTQGFLPAPTDYGYFNLNLNPSINLYGDRYKVELGATVNYVSDIENSEGEFNVYPDILASYKLLDDTVIAFLNISGGRDMNSLQSITDENIFVAPAIAIAPTNRQVDATLGIKGNLSDRFAYKLYGGYRMEENRYFFTSDTGPSNVDATTPDFLAGNTFYTQYGDLNTILVGGSLSYDFTDEINVVLGGEYMNYDVSNGLAFNNIASHLPEFTLDLTGNYEINDQWNVGTTLYFVGEREAFREGVATRSLDAFVDLNIDVTYDINPKLSAFLRGNNLTGGNYEFFNAYPVQNLQIMGGAVYKFDF